MRTTDKETPPTWNEIAMLVIGVPVAVIGLSKFSILIFIALATISWLLLRNRRGSSWERLFWLAAFFGTVGEAFCVYGTWWTRDGRGLWIYAFPGPFGFDTKLPIWLPLVWGNLFTLYAALSERIKTGSSEWLRYILVLGIVIYAGALFRTIDIRILYLFTPFFTAFLLYWNKWDDVKLFVIGALLGSPNRLKGHLAMPTAK